MIDGHLAVGIGVTASADERLTAQGFATFVYDLNLLYELHVLQLIDPEAILPGNASTWIFARNARGIPDGTRLRARHITYGSPLDILLQLRDAVPQMDLAVGAGALWVTVQALEKLYNVRANRRLIQAETRKLDAEADKLELDNAIRRAEFGAEQYAPEYAAPSRRPAYTNIDPLASAHRRLAKAPVHVERLEVEVIDYAPVTIRRHRT